MLVGVVESEILDVPLLIRHRATLVAGFAEDLAKVLGHKFLKLGGLLCSIALDWPTLLLYSLGVSKPHFGDDGRHKGRRLPEASVGNVKVDNQSLTFSKSERLVNTTENFNAATKSSALAISDKKLTLRRNKSGVPGWPFTKKVIKEV